MMSGLLERIVREVWLGVLLACLGVVGIKVVLSLIVQEFAVELSQVWLDIEFVKTMISAMLGVKIDDEITSSMIQGILWVHPLLLCLPLTIVLVLCTRFPVAEVDRGTVDVLLGLPVSRTAVYGAETIAWLSAGVMVVGALTLGEVIGWLNMDAAQRPAFGRVALVVANLYLLYTAVGGITCFVSAVTTRRIWAISIVLAILLASFLLQFLAQFWSPAEPIVFLSFLDYFRPAETLRTGVVETRDIIVLSSVTVIGWVTALLIVRRRDIATM